MSDATGDFAGLVNENVRAVFLQIYCIVGNTADARQLTETTFIRVIKQGTPTRTQTEAAARLASVASEIAWDFLGQYGCRSCSEKAEPAPALPAGFHLLTPMEREVMIMRDMNGLATATVAASIGCTRDMVRLHISRARIKMRRYLDAGGSVPKQVIDRTLS